MQQVGGTNPHPAMSTEYFQLALLGEFWFHADL
jgi:hypothetical protein